MLSLFALAMNENLSAEAFNSAVKAHCESKIRMTETMIEAVKDMTLEQKLDYVSRCLPFLFM